MRYFYFLIENNLIKVLLVCIALDTIFGVLRAIKEKKTNSGIGINGIIRKAGMLISIIFFALIDFILEFNLIAFIPETIREFINIKSIGIAIIIPHVIKNFGSNFFIILPLT